MLLRWSLGDATSSRRGVVLRSHWATSLSSSLPPGEERPCEGSAAAALHHRARRRRPRCSAYYSTVIFSNVLPDVSASAACVRTRSLVEGLTAAGGSTEEDGGGPHQVYYATSAAVAATATTTTTTASSDGKKDGRGFESTNVHILHLPPNRSDLFREAFLKDEDGVLATDDGGRCGGIGPPSSSLDSPSTDSPFSTSAMPHTSPSLFIFDRFFMEEAYSFHIHRHFPDAPLVLDMQDFHSLRWGRQSVVEAWDLSQQQRHRHHHPRDPSRRAAFDPLACLPDVLNYLPSVPADGIGNTGGGGDDRLARELASIHRCDLTLVCSPHEMDLLHSVYQIPADKLCLASFFVDGHDDDGANNHGIEDAEPSLRSRRGVPFHRIGNDDTSISIDAATASSNSHAPLRDAEYEEDDDEDYDDTGPVEFVFCGGFRHAPNVDAVNVLVDHVWPRLRQEMGGGSGSAAATLHIYGAFCPPAFQARHNRRSAASTGIYVHGHTPDLADVFRPDIVTTMPTTAAQQRPSSRPQTHRHRPGRRILLAPLRFGAGVKGKIVDAWTHGMPVVTTPVGSEGMTCLTVDGTPLFGGAVASTLDDFCHAAVNLARDSRAYRKAQQEGRVLLRTLFHAKRNWTEVKERILSLLPNERGESDVLLERRGRDYSRAMLWQQTTRSTEYFSRWIELKEAMQQNRTKW